MQRRSATGFTLIELTVGIAMASIIAAAAIASIMAIVQLLKQTERQTLVDAEAKMLGEHLVARFQGLGGSSLRPWHGLKLEERADGTDRLTFVELDESAPECPITSVDLGSIQGDPAACCFEDTHANRQLIVATQSGQHWASVIVTSVDTGSCTIGIGALDGGLASSNLPPGAPDEIAAAFANGWLVPVRVRRLWLDTATQQLKLDGDKPGTNVFEPEPDVLTDGVYDLQLALAYDSNPTDGEVLDESSTGDEWLGNHASDAMGSGGLSQASPEHLRMIAVGLLVGAPVPRLGTQTGRVLDGPERTATDVILRPVVGRAYLRNLNFFF